VNGSLEDQIRAFAAWNLDQPPAIDPSTGERLSEYPASPPDRSSTRWLLVGAVALVVVLVAGIAVWMSGGDESGVVATQPRVAADATLTIAARAAAADTKRFTGSWPEQARVVLTTVGLVGEQVADPTCAVDTPVVVVSLTWDEPIRWDGARWSEGVAPPPPTDVVQYYRVGDPYDLDRTELEAGCPNGGYGLLQQQVDLADLGLAAEVNVSEHLLVVASAHAVERASLLGRLPTSAEAVVTTPDRLVDLGVPGFTAAERSEPGCDPSEIVVVQLIYAAGQESYMGEGPFGAVNASIGHALDYDPLPLDSPTFGSCPRSGSMGPTPVDLSVLGTPIPLDLAH
jgi:hypothetical protein